MTLLEDMPLEGMPLDSMPMGMAYSPTLASMSIGTTIFSLLLAVFLLIVTCKIFTKAGRAWWEAIIPIYNIFIYLKIAGKSYWGVLWLCIPIVNIFYGISVTHALSKKFGHGVGFTLGLLFLGIIFLPLLAFGKSQYEGANSMASAPSQVYEA